MAKWNESPSWTDFDNINSGQEFTHRLSPEALNALAENVAYLYQMPELGGKEDITVILDSEDEGEITVAYSASKDIRLPASADGYWSRLSVIDNANFKSSNIKKGINLFGRIGTYDAGGQAPNLYGIEVTPTKQYQNIVPESGYDGFDEVIVNPIPDEYIIPEFTEVEDFTVYAEAEQQVDNGVLVVGYTSPKAVALPAKSEANILGGVVDENFIASNIKKGVSIFGREGTNSTPAEISTEAEMTALLTSGEVGGVYRYTGTTGTYENGALYVLEAELIYFSVDLNDFTAEKGMTWGEWKESSYNTAEIRWLDSTDGMGMQINLDGNWYFIMNGTEIVGQDETIVNNCLYTTKQETASLISFTIDGTSYQAEDGMTWYEWCNSNYNTYGYSTLNESGAYVTKNIGSSDEYVCKSASGGFSNCVVGNGTIDANATYYHYVQAGGAGN